MIRIGFDVGGSKIAAIAIDDEGHELARRRRAVPDDYARTRDAILDFARELEREHGQSPGFGIAMPGMIGADGSLNRMVNLPWLEGRPLRAELEAALERPVGIANDANCFALSEATDGAAAGARVVFGVILGTGVGGGIVVDGRPLAGANAIAGEWGHNPLPPGDDDTEPARMCGCGRSGCIEAWLSGRALVRDYEAVTGHVVDPHDITARGTEGDPAALAAIERYRLRLARALAGLINILDPDVIVLGGGLSQIGALHLDVADLWRRFTVAPAPKTRLAVARFGPDSGLRGAAWLAGDGPQKNVRIASTTR